jgi:hypothetical protein
MDSQALDTPGLFHRLVGDRWAAQPEVVRHAHGGVAPVALTGKARARGAAGLPTLVRRLQGLPPSGLHATAVTITQSAGGERWVRRFGARTFGSTIAPARDDPWAFEETAGLLTFRFSVAPYPSGFSWLFESWRLGPVPLPRAWAPRIRARTFARNGAYRFRVLVAHPWLGVIFGYAGRLALDPLTSDGA